MHEMRIQNARNVIYELLNWITSHLSNSNDWTTSAHHFSSQKYSTCVLNQPEKIDKSQEVYTKCGFWIPRSDFYSLPMVLRHTWVTQMIDWHLLITFHRKSTQLACSINHKKSIKVKRCAQNLGSGFIEVIFIAFPWYYVTLE